MFYGTKEKWHLKGELCNVIVIALKTKMQTKLNYSL